MIDAQAVCGEFVAVVAVELFVLAEVPGFYQAVGVAACEFLAFWAEFQAVD